MPDPEGDARLVERLVRVQSHPELVPDPEQQESPLGAVDGALSDQLVETLRVQLAAHLTDASLASLTLL